MKARIGDLEITGLQLKNGRIARSSPAMQLYAKNKKALSISDLQESGSGSIALTTDLASLHGPRGQPEASTLDDVQSLSRRAP
jgi:hypothetical protein